MVFLIGRCWVGVPPPPYFWFKVFETVELGPDLWYGSRPLVVLDPKRTMSGVEIPLLN